MFLTAGLEPRMWNRDMSKASRCCLISVAHFDLSWVVSATEGLTGFHNTFDRYSGLPAQRTRGIASGLFGLGGPDICR